MHHMTDPLAPPVWTYPRHTLLPLDGTPWLRPQPPSWRALGLTCLAVTGLSLYLLPFGAWRWTEVLAVNTLILVAFVLALLIRGEIQVCPGCLQSLALGATRCPHCGFAEGG